MVVGGALAAGAFGATVTLFGARSRRASGRTSSSRWPAPSATSSGRSPAGGSGCVGGRPLLDRHGRWFHLTPEKLDRAEAWFDRYGDWAVFIGRVTPVVRSFVSIPAGVFRVPFGRYTVLTLVGSALWCFALAGVGWAVGSSYESFHHGFGYVEYAVVAGILCRGLPGPACRRASRLHSRAEIPLVDVKAQYAPLIPRLERAYAEVLDSGEFILGPNVKSFEREAAEYLGVTDAIGVANGTDAIVIVLDALGIGPGDEVICPAFTFYATAEAIVRRGAVPVFADIDPATYNLDPEDVAARITPKTRAIMPVHLFGRPAPLDELRRSGSRWSRTPRRRSARRASRRTGVASTYSFYPTKNSSRSATAGLSRRTTRSSPSACGSSASTARATRSTSTRSATTRGSTRSMPPRSASSCRSSTRWTSVAPRGGRAVLASSGSASRDAAGGRAGPRVPPLRQPLARARPIVAALREAQIGTATYYVTPLHLQPALSFLG